MIGLFANETNFFESGSESEEVSAVLVAVLLVLMQL
jgi:hypothetical protein